MIDIIKLALIEDIGTGDISTQLLPNKNITASLICREKAIICGVDIFNKCFNNIKINWLVKDGQTVKADTIICELFGNNYEILSKERVALNFLQILSGTATQTRILVEKIKHTKAQILDTRKTIPGMRLLQKQAVVCGGGVNHRFGLYDEIMLKENHIKFLGITNAVQIVQQKYSNIPIIVEVENLSQLKEADNLEVTRILCDNFNLKSLKQAVKIASKPLEASGNIDINNIHQYAKTGVDFISIGAITKNIKAIDFSLIIG